MPKGIGAYLSGSVSGTSAKIVSLNHPKPETCLGNIWRQKLHSNDMLIKQNFVKYSKDDNYLKFYSVVRWGKCDSYFTVLTIGQELEEGSCPIQL